MTPAIISEIETQVKARHENRPACDPLTNSIIKVYESSEVYNSLAMFPEVVWAGMENGDAEGVATFLNRILAKRRNMIIALSTIILGVIFVFKVGVLPSATHPRAERTKLSHQALSPSSLCTLSLSSRM